jgi:transcriptional regulator with XRE-family HTH domain
MIGNQIKSYILDNGLKQGYIAKKVQEKLPKFNYRVLNEVLNERRKLDIVEYFAICDALGVSVDAFQEADNDIARD